MTRTIVLSVPLLQGHVLQLHVHISAIEFAGSCPITETAHAKYRDSRPLSEWCMHAYDVRL